MRSDTSAEAKIGAAASARAHHWLRRPWDLLRMAAGLSYWLVFGTLLTLVGGLLHLLLPRRLGGRLGRFLLHHLFRWFVALLRVMRLAAVDSRALDRIAADCGAMIIAPNHLALWDAVFIVARLPAAVCVMKQSILRNPVLGGGARLAGYIANDGMTRMIRNAARSLEDGGHLLLFPEGTRTRPEARWINPLKGGCAIIALRAGVPVLPVFIRSNTRFLQKGWPPWKPPVFPLEIHIETGEPLHPFPRESAQAFTRRLQQVFERELAKPHPLRRQTAMTGESPAS